METIATGLRELSLDNEELPLCVHTVVFNDDLLSEILVRLPVLSLVLFKSVSKHWLSLINDAAFIKRRSRIPNIDPPSGLFFERDWETNAYGFAPLDIRIRPRLENTFKTEYGNATVLQSCNGLFLCSVRPGNRFCVYNPTINMFKMLPETDNYESKQLGSMTMAFDPVKSPHYKVVHAKRIGNYYHDLFYRIQTYSSETGIWSIVCNCTDPCRGLLYGIYWNEAIHWIKFDMGRFMHYKLDFVNKPIVLTKLQLPVIVDNYYCKFFESRGCLLLLGKDMTHSDQLNVYQMRNGDSEWSFRYSVNLWRITLDHVWHIALGEREEESFMVIKLDGGEVVLYKFVLKTFCQLPESQSMLYRFDSFLFTASFASV